jgi:hypothetical protein
MGALFQARLVERPTAVEHIVAGGDQDIERHPGLDAVVAGDDVLKDGVDGLGLGLGEESDSAEIDSENRDIGVAGQFSSTQECAVAAEDQDEFAAFGGLSLIVDDFAGQHPQLNSVVLQYFC